MRPRRTGRAVVIVSFAVGCDVSVLFLGSGSGGEVTRVMIDRRERERLVLGLRSDSGRVVLSLGPLCMVDSLGVGALGVKSKKKALLMRDWMSSEGIDERMVIEAEGRLLVFIFRAKHASRNVIFKSVDSNLSTHVRKQDQKCFASLLS